MNKFSRYFMSLLAMGGAYAAPLTSHATEKEFSPMAERGDWQLDVDKIKIEGEFEEDKETVRELLWELNTTPKGKKILAKMPPDISFNCTDYYTVVYGAAYEYEKKVIYIYQDLLDGYKKGKCSKAGAADLLGHEILHAIQDKNGRLNIGIKEDGIEGYLDFTTRKLCEVETLLFHAENALNQPKKYQKDDNLQDLAQYLKLLKSTAETNPENKNKTPEEINRIAKSQFVKTLWESTEQETKGPEFMKEWAAIYNDQVMRCMKDDVVGKRDIIKENDMLQRYIDSMEIDIPISYFRDIHNCHLAESIQKQLDERERQTQMLSGPFHGLNEKLAACSAPVEKRPPESDSKLSNISVPAKNSITSDPVKIPMRRKER